MGIENTFDRLKTEIIERFKSHAYISKLGKEIDDYAEKSTLKKYKDSLISRNGWQYELFAVYAHSYSWPDDINPPMVRISLIYTTISKIKGYQKETLQKAKDQWKKHKVMGFNKGTKELWIQLTYEVESELVAQNKINLNIENDEE